MLREYERRPDAHGLYNLSALLSDPRLASREAHALQQTVAVNTIRVRGVRGLLQYGRYFASFWVYGLLEPDRADLIRSSYFWLRHVDDVADGDKFLSPRYSTKQVFLWQKRNLVEKLGVQNEPVYGDREDILLVHYFLMAQRLGIDLRQESLAILDTIIFDEERARTRRIPTQQELDDYFAKLDFACIDGALKVAGENDVGNDLKDLSWSVRIMFNLRDFPKDFARGIVNISREDIARYGINLAECEGKETVEELVTYKPMMRWYENQVSVGQNFLHQAKVSLKRAHFKRLTRFGIWFSFKRPVEQTLRKFQYLLGAV